MSDEKRAGEPVASNVKACALRAIERAAEELQNAASGKTQVRLVLQQRVNELQFAARALRGEAKLTQPAPEPAEDNRLLTQAWRAARHTAARPAEPKPYLCGDCRHADSYGIPLRKGCDLDCHYESIHKAPAQKLTAAARVPLTPAQMHAEELHLVMHALYHAGGLWPDLFPRVQRVLAKIEAAAVIGAAS